LRLTTILVLCLAGLAAITCGESAPPARGVAIRFEEACGKANEGKRVLLEGYLDFPVGGVGEKDVTVMARFRPRLASWENTIGARVAIGKAPNHLEMPPAHYNSRDVRLHLADGGVVGYANKVKLSGTLYSVSFRSPLGPGDYTCGVTDTLFERGSGYQPPPPK
jgi:hypothetical protein